MATKRETSEDFYQWQLIKRSMGERIKHLYNNTLMADVNFLVAEKSGNRESKIAVPCHKLVLGLGSPVFFAMFYGELAEIGDSIDLPDCDYEGFLEFLRYIYRDEANLTGSCVMQVLYLAKKYIIPSLTELCRRFLEKNITPQNVLDVLPQVKGMDETHLSCVCWNVIDVHTEKVLHSASSSLLEEKQFLTSFLTRDSLTINELKLFQTINCWADDICRKRELEGSGKDKREVIGEEIIKLVRFPLMTQKEFADHVPDTEILTETEIVKLFMHYSLGRNPGAFSCISRGINSKNVQRCKCFSAISEPGCFRHYNRRMVDVLRFKVNAPVVIRGVRLFGFQNEKYLVNVKVSDTSVAEDLFQTEQEIKDGYHGFDVIFKHPFHLLPEVTCFLQAFIHGPKSFYGLSGEEEINCGKVTFLFIENKDPTENGSTVSRGPFAEVLFTCV